LAATAQKPAPAGPGMGVGQTPTARMIAPSRFSINYCFNIIKLVVVQGVLSEPVSASFPVKQGKNREFSQYGGILSVLPPRNTLELRQFLSNFPTHKNREFKSLNREFF